MGGAEFEMHVWERLESKLFKGYICLFLQLPTTVRKIQGTELRKFSFFLAVKVSFMIGWPCCFESMVMNLNGMKLFISWLGSESKEAMISFNVPSDGKLPTGPAPFKSLLPLNSTRLWALVGASRMQITSPLNLLRPEWQAYHWAHSTGSSHYLLTETVILVTICAEDQPHFGQLPYVRLYEVEEILIC